MLVWIERFDVYGFFNNFLTRSLVYRYKRLSDFAINLFLRFLFQTFKDKSKFF